jgi:hypothetical protein
MSEKGGTGATGTTRSSGFGVPETSNPHPTAFLTRLGFLIRL